ncbi:MAG: phasin family protein [Desulfuromonas sp.]|nr:phasin family protein [Desulfuromonas sp.]
MLEIIEKTLLTTLGAASLTQKKAEELAAELKERFNLSEDEGKALVDKLKKTASDRQTKLEEQASDEVRKACERIGIITKKEFSALSKRVLRLEKQLSDD